MDCDASVTISTSGVEIQIPALKNSGFGKTSNGMLEKCDGKPMSDLNFFIGWKKVETLQAVAREAVYDDIFGQLRSGKDPPDPIRSADRHLPPTHRPDQNPPQSPGCA